MSLGENPEVFPPDQTAREQNGFCSPSCDFKVKAKSRQLLRTVTLILLLRISLVELDV